MCSEKARASRIVAILIVSFAITAGLALLPQPALAIEKELAGLRLWQSYDTIFKKYGVPKSIDIGQTATQVTFTDQPAILNLRTGRSMGGVGGGAGDGMGTPYAGATNPSMMGGATTQQTDQTTVYLEDEITYYYLKNDVVIIVTVAADHKIAEIGAYAMTSEAQRRGGFKTSRGIGMNNTYVDIINKYGFPNQHRTMGAGLTLITYTETNNVSFLLDEQYRVVALVIATNEVFSAAVSQGIGR